MIVLFLKCFPHHMNVLLRHKHQPATLLAQKQVFLYALAVGPENLIEQESFRLVLRYVRAHSRKPCRNRLANA